jgi:hypothetical protein
VLDDNRALGWSTCELGDRTAITSTGGSGIGVVTTIKSCIDMQPALSVAAAGPHTVHEVGHVTELGVPGQPSRRGKSAMSSQYRGRNGIVLPWLRTGPIMQIDAARDHEAPSDLRSCRRPRSGPAVPLAWSVTAPPFRAEGLAVASRGLRQGPMNALSSHGSIVDAWLLR